MPLARRPRLSPRRVHRGRPAAGGFDPPRRLLARPGRSRLHRPAPQATDVAAAADHVRVVADLDVADITRASLCAAVEAAVGDDPGPDAGPDLDDDHVGVAGGDARAPLPESNDIDVVVDPDRGPIASRETLPDRVAIPAGHDGRRDRPSGPELDRSRHADADAPQATRYGMRRPEEEVKQRLDAFQACLRAGLDERRLVVVREDPPVEGREGDIDACGTQVGDEDVAGVAPEREVARRPAARARTRVAFADEPPIDHLGDAPGDDRPTEAGPLDELGTRARPPEADLVEDDDERVEDLVGQRRRRSTLGDLALYASVRQVPLENGRRASTIVFLRVKRRSVLMSSRSRSLSAGRSSRRSRDAVPIFCA